MTQAQALDILKTGANVFLTGEPGSGKTHTINEYVAYLRSCGIEPAITASTGIAATHIGGMTIHSWCGIGVKNTITDYDLELITQKERVVRRVSHAQVLIIDEISMLASDTLSAVDMVCKAIRRRSAPFGGLQVIFVGDFFQLPPIVKQKPAAQTPEDSLYALEYEVEESKAPFAFRSPAWRAAAPLVCYLSEQHRQEDGVFLDVLSSVRRGTVTEEMRGHLKKRAVRPAGNRRVTKLYPHNANVDALNESELGSIDGTPRSFFMRSRGAPLLVEALKRSCLSPETLFLKVGAKVMFTKNNPEGEYVNGTTGEVIEFSRISGNPVVKIAGGTLVEAKSVEWSVTDGSTVLARIEQVPLRLAWAITVHKSQGMSLDSAIIDLSKAFEYGQGYVALSRVRTLAGLYLLGFNERALEVHPEVAEKDEDFRAASDATSDAFTEMKPKELAEMHTNFLKACGGAVGSGSLSGTTKKKQEQSTYEITLALLKQKMSVADMARERSMTQGTIVGHIEKLLEDKVITQKEIAHLSPPPRELATLHKAFSEVFKKQGTMPLSPVRTLLKDKYTFDELRLARLFISPEND